MIRSRIRAALLAVGAAVAAPTALGAQVTVGKPIDLKAPKPKIVKFKGQVVQASIAQIVVRSSENERVIRSFSFSPKVREAMQKIIDRGGYQHGDKVEIHHEAGSDVALKVKGKPSKPL